MKTCPDHFERLFGELSLSPQDAARWVFASGWNAALDEFTRRLNTMPFGDDTRASFAVYIGSMMHIQDEEKKGQMQ